MTCRRVKVKPGVQHPALPLLEHLVEKSLPFRPGAKQDR
jgi:hypothetical protein